MSLSVGIGSVNHRIDTVKGSENAGSGRLSLEVKGEEGTFTLDGKDEKGTTIKGSIECAKFSPQEVVAG